MRRPGGGCPPSDPHGFFKGPCFPLFQGSVIHAMEEVVGTNAVLAQDTLRLHGSLRKHMPDAATS